MFTWQLNEVNPRTYKSFVSLSEPTADGTITNLRRTIRMGGNYSEYGRCLAWCHLYGDIDEVPGNILIKAGKEVTALSQLVEADRLIASVSEFQVNVPAIGDLEIRIRTLVTPQNVSDCAFTKAPVPYFEPPPNQTIFHCRDWWPRSDLHLRLTQGAYCRDVSIWNDEPPKYVHASKLGLHVVKPPPLLAPYAWQGATLDPEGTPNGNRGLFGVNAKYTFYAKNTGPTDSNLIVHVRAPQPPDLNTILFCGAARKPGTAKKGIEALKEIPQNQQAVQIASFAIPAGAGPTECTVEHAVGGTSSFPLVFVLSHGVPP